MGKQSLPTSPSLMTSSSPGDRSIVPTEDFPHELRSSLLQITMQNWSTRPQWSNAKLWHEVRFYMIVHSSVHHLPTLVTHQQDSLLVLAYGRHLLFKDSF